MAASEERDHSLVHLERERDPGEPYTPAPERAPQQRYHVQHIPDLLDGACWRVRDRERPDYRSPPLTLEAAEREAERINGQTRTIPISWQHGDKSTTVIDGDGSIRLPGVRGRHG